LSFLEAHLGADRHNKHIKSSAHADQTWKDLLSTLVSGLFCTANEALTFPSGFAQMEANGSANGAHQRVAGFFCNKGSNPPLDAYLGAVAGQFLFFEFTLVGLLPSSIVSWFCWKVVI